MFLEVPFCAGDIAISRADNFPVTLNCDAVSPIDCAANLRGNLPRSVKARIQTSIRGVASRREEVASTAAGAGETRDDDFPIVLNRNTISDVAVAAKVRGYLAGAVETCVQTAVGVVAD